MKRKQVEDDTDCCSSVSCTSTACETRNTASKGTRSQRSRHNAEPKVADQCLMNDTNQDVHDQGLKYLENLLCVDSYSKPTYHRGTSIPVEGWIQPCSGCRSWTASSVMVNPSCELPLCKRCLIQIINLQRAQAQQPVDASVPEGTQQDANCFVHSTKVTASKHISAPALAKPRRWSEADLENTSSQDSATSETYTETQPCASSKLPNCALSHQACRTSELKLHKHHASSSPGKAVLKRRAVRSTP